MNVTLQEVYALALNQQTMIWSKENDFAKDGNKIAKARADAAWQKLKEIERQYWELPEVKERYA